MRLRHFSRWGAYLIATCVVLSVGCNKADPPAKKGPGGRGGRGGPAVHVQTATVQRISVQRQVELAGTLISPDSATVSSEVGGIVRQVKVEIGQEVRPGQTLAQLDPRELQLALTRAESLLHQTEAQVGIDGTRQKEPPPDEQIAVVRTSIANRDDARAQLARAQMLMQKRLISQADLDTAETRVKVTEAGYQSALESVQALKATLRERRAAVELAQKDLADADIKAPVGGSVAERLIQTGEYIRENTPVLRLVQLNPLKLRTAVQERHASLIRPGLPVRFQVESSPGEVFQGQVAFVSPAIDQATRTFAVEILVQNADRRLKPGFFAKGAIYTRLDENVLAVTENAVSTLAGVSMVYVIKDNRVTQQVIEPGLHQGNLVEVTNGLKGDELLASSNLSQLANGVAVDVGPAPKAEPSASGRGREGERNRDDEGVRP